MRDSSIRLGPGAKMHMHLVLDAKGPQASPPVEIRPVSLADVAIEDALWARRGQAIAQAQEAMEASTDYSLMAESCQDPDKKLIYIQAAKLEKEKAQRLWESTVIGYNGQLSQILSADKNFNPSKIIDELVDGALEKARIQEPRDGAQPISSSASEGSSKVSKPELAPSKTGTASQAA